VKYMRRLVIAVVVGLLSVGCSPAAPDDAGPAPAPAPSDVESPDPDGSPTGEESPDPEAADEQSATVEVFFANDGLGAPCGEVFPVERRVSATTPAQGALEALLAGPTADEQAEGYGGWFSDATAGALRSVSIEDGVARVDLADLRGTIPNASTSCGSAGFLAQLDESLLQFSTVDTTVYALEGDVEAFYEWLQLAPPEG